MLKAILNSYRQIRYTFSKGMGGRKKILLIKNAFPVEQFTLRKSPAIYSKKMPNNFYFENARGFPKKIVNLKGPPPGGGPILVINYPI